MGKKGMRKKGFWDSKAGRGKRNTSTWPDRAGQDRTGQDSWSQKQVLRSYASVCHLHDIRSYGICAYVCGVCERFLLSFLSIFITVGTLPPSLFLHFLTYLLTV